MGLSEHGDAVEDIVAALAAAAPGHDEHLYGVVCAEYSDPGYGPSDDEALSPQRHLDVMVEMFACAVLKLASERRERAWSDG